METQELKAFGNNSGLVAHLLIAASSLSNKF
jgi:hypothetical protein